MITPLSIDELTDLYNTARTSHDADKRSIWRVREYPKLRDYVKDMAFKCKEYAIISVPQYIDMDYMTLLFPGCDIEKRPGVPCSSHSYDTDENDSYTVRWIKPPPPKVAKKEDVDFDDEAVADTPLDLFGDSEF